jgi:hypothetical protein
VVLMRGGRALIEWPIVIALLCTFLGVLAIPRFQSSVPVSTAAAALDAVATQESRQPSRDLAAFHVLLNAYRAGEDLPVETLAGWDTDRLVALQKYIETPSDDYRPWDRRRFEVAAMLHADTALLLLETGDREGAIAHVDLGGRLLVRGGARLHEFASAWFVAISRLLRARLETQFAHRVLDLARDRLPGDAAVLFESATLQELQATDTRLTWARWDEETYDKLRERRMGHLNKAAQWLRQVLARVPEHLEAQLHLGRTQMLRGEAEDALRLLAGCGASSTPSTAYLSWLFTGAIRERQKRFDAAITAYQRARALLPRAQTAHVALSEALHAAGRIGEAELAVSAWLKDPGPRSDDPWLSYYDAPLDAVGLDALRRQVRT